MAWQTLTTSTTMPLALTWHLHNNAKRAVSPPKFIARLPVAQVKGTVININLSWFLPLLIKSSDSRTVNSCSLECSKNLISCYNSCPCFENCPSGCSNCKSEFCEGCDAETDQNYLACAADAQSVYISCISTCAPGDTECPADCNRAYHEDLNKCPCMEGCPTGCPCPNYECAISTTDSPGTGTTPNPLVCPDFPVAAECKETCQATEDSCINSCGNDSTCKYNCTQGGILHVRHRIWQNVRGRIRN